MFSVGEYGSIHPEEPYNASSGGGRPFLSKSSTYESESLGNTINFIDNRLQLFKESYAGRTFSYE